MGLARQSHNTGRRIEEIRQRQKLRSRQGSRPSDDDVAILEVLDGHDRDIEWAFRNFQYKKQPDSSSSGGGGGEPIKRFPIAQIICEMEEFRPSMEPVMFPLWGNRNTRYFVGIAHDVSISGIAGVVYVESLGGGVPSIFHVNALPIPESGSTFWPAGTLMGFDVGFGQYGTERLKFRLDAYRFHEGPTSTLQEVEDGGVKYQSTRAILDETLLTEYTTDGLRFKCILSLYA